MASKDDSKFVKYGQEGIWYSPEGAPLLNLRADSPERAKYDFLLEFRKSFNVGRACAAAGVTRATVYNWRYKDEQFAQAWEEAKEAIIDAVEANLFDIALDKGENGRTRVMASFGLLNAHRAGYARKDVGSGQPTQINFIIGPKPDETPKQLPPVAGDEIVIVDDSD
jgi:hypothetical protein